MKNHYELLVIGGGPAGLAAASQAASSGVHVALVDEQKTPGGQIYRNVKNATSQDSKFLGKDYMRGKRLVNEFLECGAEYLRNALVWYLDDKLEVGLLIDGASHFVSADRLILATGALERPMPMPGWQLPGVMTAGAGQILLKSASLVPQGKLALAGSGPLLLLIAWQYIQAGVKIEALIDTTPNTRFNEALYRLPAALPAIDYLIKGLSLMFAIKKAGVPIYKNATDLRAHGQELVESVSFNTPRGTSENGATHQLPVDTLLLHQGVIPNLRLPLAAGCQVHWDKQQHNWRVEVDDWGQSSVERVLIGGDCASIVGARAAELQGRLCGLQVARSVEKLDVDQRDREARTIRASLKRHTSIRSFLNKLYAPADEFLLPADETMVCRCEEINAGQIRRAAGMGCVGPNQVKAFTRCGMGPCQGNQCGSTVSALVADETNTPIEEVGFFRVRPPFKPITLGELSDSQ